jgi:hypothetical protein
VITREITALDELAALADDCRVLWAAQGLERGGRAWAGEDAVFAAAPSISMRDRLAVSARSPEAAVALAREVLPQLPRTFRPFGERALVEAIVADTPTGQACATTPAGSSPSAPSPGPPRRPSSSAASSSTRTPAARASPSRSVPPSPRRPSQRTRPSP